MTGGNILNVMTGGNILNIMTGGASGKTIMYGFPIFIALIASMYVIYKYAKRSKCIAYLLTFLPPLGIPANRIYTGHAGLNFGTFFRMLFPPVGIPWDIYLLYSGKMNPKQGWTSGSKDGKCKLF